MPELSQQFEKVLALLQQHGIHLESNNLIPAAALVLIFGVGLSVLGAKLARPAFVLLFAGAGALAGFAVAERAGLSIPVCTIVSGALVAIIGYITFRLWVGMAVVGVLAALVFGGFSYQELLPVVPEFEQSYMANADASGGTASAGPSIPAPGEKPHALRQASYLVQDFWNYASAQKPNLTRNAQALGLGTLVVGLFLGVVAVRWSLVLATSLLGTILVSASVMTLMREYAADGYQSLGQNPKLALFTVAGFFITSVVLQGLLTREAAKESDAD